MKNPSRYLITCIFTLLAACSSSDDFQEGNAADNTIYTIKVKEHKTNLPLQGVEISSYYCKYDNEFGCQKRQLSTYITDLNGETRIPKIEYEKADEGFISRKPQYWALNMKRQEITLEPEAWVKISLKTNTTFPNTSYFILKTKGELGVESILRIKTPKDTIVNFRLFGNEMNNIDWTVYKTGYPPYCNPCDILTSGNLSLNPHKFETLTSSINY